MLSKTTKLTIQINKMKMTIAMSVAEILLPAGCKNINDEVFSLAVRKIAA
ncbi:hypothetical protein GW590_11750 [Rahnella sp. SAP-1]|uniref:Uncharacterized protein n=1 Tax=Rouxiella aceris TaxID=2703884 RepID=A0A848MJU2_9GAMM|nr:hypothetical protein [Rouxiella aceris]NMP27533.1 hypothetical protein [Rouxiella aceris]